MYFFELFEVSKTLQLYYYFNCYVGMTVICYGYGCLLYFFIVVILTSVLNTRLCVHDTIHSKTKICDRI